jgi:hypothetical protein
MLLHTANLIYILTVSDVPLSIKLNALLVRLISFIASESQSSVFHTQYCSGDKIEKNEMGGLCSEDGREERRV